MWVPLEGGGEEESSPSSQRGRYFFSGGGKFDWLLGDFSASMVGWRRRWFLLNIYARSVGIRLKYRAPKWVNWKGGWNLPDSWLAACDNLKLNCARAWKDSSEFWPKEKTRDARYEILWCKLQGRDPRWLTWNKVVRDLLLFLFFPGYSHIYSFVEQSILHFRVYCRVLVRIFHWFHKCFVLMYILVRWTEYCPLYKKQDKESTAAFS